MATADQKLQRKLVMKLPKMGEEELRSISSMGSARQPRTSTPVEGARPRSAEVEHMEVDTPAVQVTSQSSHAGVTTHPANQAASASQARPQSTGPHSRPGPKTKQRATDQQGFLERHGHSGTSRHKPGGLETAPKDELPGRTLRPPTWVVH